MDINDLVGAATSNYEVNSPNLFHPDYLARLHEVLDNMTPEMLAQVDRAYGVEHPPEELPVPTALPAPGWGQRLKESFAGLQNQPQAPPQSFGAGLAGGLIHGLGSAGSRAQAERQNLEDMFHVKQAETDLANQKATAEWRATRGKARAEFVGKLATEAMKPKTPEKIVSVVDPTTGKPIFVPESQAVGRMAYEKPEKSGAPVVVKDSVTGKDVYATPENAIGKEPGSKTGAAETFDPSDYASPEKADTSTLGYKYVNLGSVPDKKQQAQVTDLARKNGIPVITAKDAGNLALINKARDHFRTIAGTVGMPLPPDTWELPAFGEYNRYQGPLGAPLDIAGRLTKPLEQRTGIGGQAGVFQQLKSESDAAITAVQGMGSFGTGMRITKEQILMTLRNNIPQPADTPEQARQKINTTLRLLNDAEGALLHARNPMQASQQAGSAASRAQAVWRPQSWRPMGGQ